MRKALAALAAASVLASCATAGGEREYRLAELWIDDDSGVRPYLQAVGPLPELSAWERLTARPLPVGRIAVSSLPGPVAWMGRYDFDRDGTVAAAEMTQGWLVRAAELGSSRAYAPAALMAVPGVASMVAQAPVALAGLRLLPADGQRVRAVLQKSATGAAELAALEAVLAATSGGEGGGGGDGGSGGGGGY